MLMFIATLKCGIGVASYVYIHIGLIIFSEKALQIISSYSFRTNLQQK